MPALPAPIIEQIQAWARFVLGELCCLPGATLPDEATTRLRQAGLLAAAEHCIEKHTGQTAFDQISTADIAGIQNTVMAAQLHPIVSAFNEKNLDFRVLKGMAASLTIYRQNEGARPMSDIDILVKPESLLTAAKCLEHLDFTLVKDNHDARNPRVNQIGLVKSMGQSRINVDLHRLPHNWPLLHSLASDAFAPHLSCHVGRVPINTPSFSLVWVVAHRMKDYYVGDLRELLDVRLMLHTMTQNDINETLQLLRKHHLLKPAIYLLTQAEFWFGGKTELLCLLNNLVESDYSYRTRESWGKRAINLTIGKTRLWCPANLRAYQGAMEIRELRRDAITALIHHSTRRWKSHH